MRIFKENDVFYGKNYADLINKTIGTSFAGYMKCSVNLEPFGAPGVIAWFVFMDGSEHGYEEGWKWVNKLSLDQNIIDEYNVSSNKNLLRQKICEEGYNPYRLAFQLDPYGQGANSCCRFIGAFRLQSFIRKDGTARSYEKVLKNFKLGHKGEFSEKLNHKEDLFPVSGIYLTPIDEMGFSQNTYSLLANAGLHCAGELLELGVGCEGPLAEEIQKKVCEHFKFKTQP